MGDQMPYRAITRGIEVSVEPAFVAQQAVPGEQRFVWAYRVRIDNQGPETVQLRSRHWRITDARGALNEFRGEGVVGQQPVLKPGDAFQYSSWVPLHTPSGIMMGTYQMEAGNKEVFDIEIPVFSLDSPGNTTHLN